MLKFKKIRVRKLRNLKTSNLKEFWKLINSEDRRSPQMPTLDELHNFFKNLNSNDNDQMILNEGTDSESLNEINEEINQPISKEEILHAVKNLKNNKSPGSDNILNDHIKRTINILLPINTHLFNLILDTRFVSESWVLGYILSIYKNKGSIKLSDNYRSITLLSSLGKLFTSILNNRLNKFVEHYEIISQSQAGFRKGLSTTDNLFILQSLFEISKACKKQTFLCVRRL